MAIVPTWTRPPVIASLLALGFGAGLLRLAGSPLAIASTVTTGHDLITGPGGADITVPCGDEATLIVSRNGTATLHTGADGPGLAIAGWFLETGQGLIRLSDFVPDITLPGTADSAVVRITATDDRVAVNLAYVALPARRELRIILAVSYRQPLELTRGGLDVAYDPALELYHGPWAIIARDATRSQPQTLFTQRAILVADPVGGRDFCVHGLQHGARGVELLAEDAILFYDGEVHCTVLRRPTYEEEGEHRAARREAGAQDAMTVVLDLDTARPSVWINTFPGECPAALTIVDDADGERRDLLLAAYYGTSDTTSADFGRGGLLGHGLQITRTIFAASRLHDVWDRLQADGTEIALHTATGGADSADVTARALAELVPRYGVRHWVDHSVGSNPEDLSFRGSYPREDNPFYILDLLETYGFDYAWVEGNMFRGFDAFRDRRELPHRQDALDDPGIDGQLLVYGRGGGVFFENYWNCMRDAVTPATLDQLALSAGLAVLYTHTCVVRYLGADVGYLQEVGNAWEIKPEADELFAALAQRRDAGQLWVAPAATIFDRLRAVESLRLTDVGRAVDGREILLLSNLGSLAVEELGLCLQNCASVAMNGRFVAPTDEGWYTMPRLGAGEEILIEALALFPPVAAHGIAALPNPSRGTTGLYFELPGEDAGRDNPEMWIQDCLGRVIWRGSPREVGAHCFWIEWNGCDDRGRPVPAGRYWAALHRVNRSRATAILLIR